MARYRYRGSLEVFDCRAIDVSPVPLSGITGGVFLAQGNAQAALVALRDAWTAWQQLEARCEAARARVLIGRACRDLGDEETARSHYDAAAKTFEQLGAAPALAELEKPEATPHAVSESPLSSRELQVLRLVATGQSNREIAARLFISEHTVAGHLRHIFNKLGVASRERRRPLSRSSTGFSEQRAPVNPDHASLRTEW